MRLKIVHAPSDVLMASFALLGVYHINEKSLPLDRNPLTA